MAASDFDVVVIGSGPGGYVAAIRAAQLGLKAAVVEQDKVGGVCLNVGCIPSKALIHQAEPRPRHPGPRSAGREGRPVRARLRKAYAKSRKAADTLSRGVQFLLKKNNVELIPGEATLAGPNAVAVGRQDGERGALVVATGSRPREIPGFPFDGKVRALLDGRAHARSACPGGCSMLGGGAIGVEFAHVLNAFGVAVHLVEMMDRILPLEDAGTVAVLDKSLRRRGVTIATATKAVGLETSADGARVHPRGPRGQPHDGRGRPGARGGRPDAEHRRPRPRAAGHRPRARVHPRRATGTGRRCRRCTPSATSWTPRCSRTWRRRKARSRPSTSRAGPAGPASTRSRSRAPSTASPRSRASGSPRRRRRRRAGRSEGRVPLPGRGQVRGHRADRGPREAARATPEPGRSSARTWSAPRRRS